jgi:predicted RND superfamily exporter protein
MWIWVSRFILRNKIPLLIILTGITIYMGYRAAKIEMSYEYTQLLPQDDPAFVDYKKFLKLFGEEGNLIVIGIQDPDFFKLEHFQRWQKLSSDLEQVVGVEGLLSVPNTYNLIKDTTEKAFKVVKIFPVKVSTQSELDSLKSVFSGLPFYRKTVYNRETQTYLLAITVNKDRMVTKDRERLVLDIRELCVRFEKEANLKLYYSGLPYIRVMNSLVIKREVFLFIGLALAICITILFIFLRSVKSVIAPVLIVLISVIWSMGMLAMFDYKITILTGMIPPLIIIIGISNSIYMLNKFHHEFMNHGNRIKALQRAIIKIGSATFMTDLTAAIGFGTFIIVRNDMLKQFGVIASINIIGLFLLSLILIPIIFSFVDPPSPKHIKHLKSKAVTAIIERIIVITGNHRKAVYICTLIILGIGIFGATKVKTSGFMVDDIPKKDPIYKDLKFFEENFDGLMPIEIIIDTKKPNGVMQLSTFNKIDQLEKSLEGIPELSQPLSLLNLLKFAKQGFYNGKESYYQLPNNREKDFILSYASKGEGNANLLHSFIDSTRQITRISIRMDDVGTKKMGELYQTFNTKVDSIFPAENYNVTVTGSSVVFFKGTKYLLNGLFSSLALALFLIAAFMTIMFSSWRMVVVSLVPNIIPLVVTAAVMGFAGIPIKASTILVFNVAFGIAVDSTIQYLNKYRQELKLTNWDIRKSVVLALRETGVGMIYTSVVLFFGFGIFSISSFGGTMAMGILVSLTLLVAITSNLILLPALLSGLERWTTTQAFKEPLLHIYDEEEDIELAELQIKEGSKETDE